jgi:DNA-binding response OmpR family regulator
MRVLIVEDEALVRMLVRDLLEEAGFACEEAADAAQALALLDRADPVAMPDLLVTDLNLGPGPDGLAVAAEARRRRPGLRVVYATGNPDMLDRRALPPGDRVFSKPFDAFELAAEVRAMARGA